MHAEKLLAEALMKVDLLQAEVKALKDIVKSPSKRTLRFGRKFAFAKNTDEVKYFQIRNPILLYIFWHHHQNQNSIH